MVTGCRNRPTRAGSALGFEAWNEALALAQGDPASDLARQWSATGAGKRLLASIFGNSPFLSGVAVKEWAFLTGLVEEGPDPLFGEIAASVEKTEDLGEDTAAVMRRLRVAKRRVALVAALAELAGVWSLEQQTAALSRFAEAALGAALRHLLREAARKGLIALTAADQPEQDSGLIVLGIGKLGGYELNYSSDIDLIILYDPVVGTGECARRGTILFCPPDARAGANPRSLHRRRLFVPHRSSASPGSGIDTARHVGSRGARLL